MRGAGVLSRVGAALEVVRSDQLSWIARDGCTQVATKGERRQTSQSAPGAGDRPCRSPVRLDSPARRASLCRGGSTQCCTAPCEAYPRRALSSSARLTIRCTTEVTARRINSAIIAKTRAVPSAYGTGLPKSTISARNHPTNAHTHATALPVRRPRRRINGPPLDTSARRCRSSSPRGGGWAQRWTGPRRRRWL
jgi:hypothetical protein